MAPTPSTRVSGPMPPHFSTYVCTCIHTYVRTHARTYVGIHRVVGWWDDRAACHHQARPTAPRSRLSPRAYRHVCCHVYRRVCRQVCGHVHRHVHGDAITRLEPTIPPNLDDRFVRVHCVAWCGVARRGAAWRASVSIVSIGSRRSQRCVCSAG